MYCSHVDSVDMLSGQQIIQLHVQIEDFFTGLVVFGGAQQTFQSLQTVIVTGGNNN